MRSKRGLAVLFAASLFAGIAGADVIYDNGSSLLLGGVTSNSNFPVADNFILAEGASTITDIHWTGFYLEDIPVKLAPDPSADNFIVYIYGDNGGEPGAAPLYTFTDSVQRTSNGNNNSGAEEFDYVMNIAPLELSANTTYWLSIVNDVDSDVQKGSIVLGPDWLWSTAQFGGDAHQKLPTAWVNLEAEYAFHLTNDGVVPEPASLTLMGLGIVAIAARKRLLRAR